MSYNKANFKRISEEYMTKNLRAKEDAERRKKVLHARFPEIAGIDNELAMTGLKLMQAAKGDPATLHERIDELKRGNEELLSARRDILLSKGVPEDYSDVHYECPDCMDTGMINGVMCKCMRRALVLAGYESSGIGNLIVKQSFDNFDLSYYSGDERRNMERALEKAKSFAVNFGEEKARNLLFMGTTGLGKTHLSSAIAKTVIDRGYDVVYETANNIFNDFEYERFGRGYQAQGSELRTARYFDCELLIIDDLGTEVSNQFTVATLYNLLNARLIGEKSMIISTNIKKEELFSRYADRITSRIFGEFELILFSGKDIRSQKLARGER